MADDTSQNQSASTPSSPAESPSQPPADLSGTSPPDSTSPVPEVSPSADLTPPSADSVSPPNSTNQTNESNSPISPKSLLIPSLSASTEIITTDNTNMAPPENQTPQVQSAPPASIPGDINNNETNISSQSAEIKRETIQPVSNAPSSDLSTDLSAETSVKAEASAKVDASSRRQKAVQVRKQKHDENLSKILDLLQKKGRVNNNDVRDFLRVSQSTVTDYLHTLVTSGKIKKEGKGKATYYSLI